MVMKIPFVTNGYAGPEYFFARFGGVTSYIQRVMNVLFLKTSRAGYLYSGYGR